MEMITMIVAVMRASSRATRVEGGILKGTTMIVVLLMRAGSCATGREGRTGKGVEMIVAMAAFRITAQTLKKGPQTNF